MGVNESAGAQPAGATRKTFAADVKLLGELRQFVEDAVLAVGGTQRTADDLVQAADELSANIILHGYRGAAGEIEVVVQPEGQGVVVTLRDAAPHFDPLSVAAPDLSSPLEKRPVGGLGIFLSRKLTDELRYRALPGQGNELILVKHSLGADGAPA